MDPLNIAMTYHGLDTGRGIGKHSKRKSGLAVFINLFGLKKAFILGKYIGNNFMIDTENLEDMPLTAVLQEWMNGEGWDDEIEILEDRTMSQVFTRVKIVGQLYPLYLEVKEEAELFLIFLYTPFSVTSDKFPEVLRMINRINLISGGRLACEDDGEANPIQYKHYIDVEGSTFTPTQISNMYNHAIALLSNYQDVLTKVSLTDQTTNELWIQTDQPPANGQASKLVH